MKTTARTLCADESPQGGVRRIADGLIGEALRHARSPSRDPLEDVHLVRTTTKRLRALLRLIRPVIAKASFEREDERLKRIAHQLAPFRDCAVAVETLKALGKSPDALWRIDPPGTGKPTPTRGCQRALRQACRDLEAARRGFQRLRIGGKGWEAIEPGLLKTYRQARRRMKEAATHPSDRTFHRWRIRVKQLAYQLAWLEPVRPNRFAKMRRRLHQLEESLGADHDLVIVRALLETPQTTPDNFEGLEQVKKVAAKRSRRLRRIGARLGAKALRETPRRFQQHLRRHGWSNATEI